MRRQVIISILLLLLPCLALPAREPGTASFRFGIEWGGCSTLYTAMHQNYTVEDGYRVDENHAGGTFIGNAQMLANAGVNITPHIALAAYSGLTGISKDFRVVPLTLRGTYFFKDMHCDGMLCYLDGGVGLKCKNLSDICTLLSAGTGYHLALSRAVSLEFLACVRLTLDRPDIMDPDTGKAIPAENIRVNNARYGALNFSVALSF